MAEENLESKLAPEDKTAWKDKAIGIGTTLAVPFVGGGGLACAFHYHDAMPVLSIIAGGVSLVAAFLLYNVGCFYFTLPSERADYGARHPWMPKRVVNYLQK
jgi:hypothetical protein